MERYLAEELFGETEIFKQLIQCFAEEVAELKAAQGDLSQIAHFAHKVKPACLTYGAQSLSVQLQKLEALAKSKKSDEAFRLYTEILPDLESMVRELLQISKTL